MPVFLLLKMTDKDAAITKSIDTITRNPAVEIALAAASLPITLLRLRLKGAGH